MYDITLTKETGYQILYTQKKESCKEIYHNNKINKKVDETFFLLVLSCVF